MENETIDEKDWFLLLNLAKLGALDNPLQMTTTEIAKSLGSTQQTISRRLKKLRETGHIDPAIWGTNKEIMLTTLGRSILKDVFIDLKTVFRPQSQPKIYKGYVQRGMGEGKYYVSLPTYFENFSRLLGSKPYLGTLNVTINSEQVEEYYAELDTHPYHIIEGFETEDRTFGPVKCYDILVCKINDHQKCVKGLILDIKRTSHTKGTVEIVSDKNLRILLDLDDDSRVAFKFADDLDEKP